LKYLHLDADQINSINAAYDSNTHYHRIFSSESSSNQGDAIQLLGGQGMDVHNLEDLGNRWAIRWSTKIGKSKQRRFLLQWYAYSSIVGCILGF